MLKVLKGSRILVDCETGDLHVDLGDGQCKPMGGGVSDVTIVYNSDGRELLSAPVDLYNILVNAFYVNKAPVRVNVWNAYDGGAAFRFTPEDVTVIQMWEEGGPVRIDIGTSEYIECTPDGNITIGDYD